MVTRGRMYPQLVRFCEMEFPKPPPEHLEAARAACVGLWRPGPPESGMTAAIESRAFPAAFRAQFELFTLFIWIQVADQWDRAVAATDVALEEFFKGSTLEPWVREIYEASMILEVLGLWYPWIFKEEELVLDSLELTPGIVTIRTVAKRQLLAQWFQLALTQALRSLKESVGHPPFELHEKVAKYQAFATKLVFGSGLKLTGTELAAALRAQTLSAAADHL